MNLRTLSTVSTAPSRPAQQAAKQPGDAKTISVSTDRTARPHLRIVRDNVVISRRSQRLFEENGYGLGLDLAIRSSLGVDPLEEVRAFQVRDRIESGFYSQPEVVKEVAGLLGHVLTTGS